MHLLKSLYVMMTCMVYTNDAMRRRGEEAKWQRGMGTFRNPKTLTILYDLDQVQHKLLLYTIATKASDRGRPDERVIRMSKKRLLTPRCLCGMI
jgi:hypothetical protein